MCPGTRDDRIPRSSLKSYEIKVNIKALLFSQPKIWLNDIISMPFSHRLVNYQETGKIHLVHEGGSIYNGK